MDAGTDAEVTPVATQGLNALPVPPPPPDKPMLGVTAFVTNVYAEPRDTSKKLGYLRVGTKVARSDEPAGKAGCPGGWYQIHPRGYVCVGKDATLDLEDPLLKAASRGPNLRKALPYHYAFVRAVLPLYLRVPTADEQQKSEFKLKDHLDWFEQNKGMVQKVTLGATDVAIDERGVPLPGKKVGELGLGKNSLELGEGVLLGGETENDPIPFWLEGGKRAIPNISEFAVPDYAVFADRARRFTGLSLVGSFPTGPESLGRRFAITADMRLAPNTKIKPDTGSTWHGVELTEDFTLPLAFVRNRGVRTYQISGNKATPGEELELRSIHQLTGRLRKAEGVKYYRTKDKQFLSELDVGLAIAPDTWPEAAEKGEKWIEVSIKNQTLVLWEGKRPIYATLVSTGQAGMGDPKTTTATVRGVFRIRNKHISATMDSNESTSEGGQPDRVINASVSQSGPPKESPAKDKDSSPAAKKAGKGTKDAKGAKNAKAGGKDKPTAPVAPAAKDAGKNATAAPADAKVPRRGDGEYGVTRRRGEGTYKLRDVPYIQYFASGYALHTAYWHDVFGTPRSHGCINMSPVDGHRVFLWTEPAVPEGWHAAVTGEEMGEGTVVIVHE
ncbi:L,D-transpeptidase family protein [Chondromyces apiculatus]|uniref:L,D-transpeptidase family protein n=1 Tax=Chondromyces apiculatus TaxID=51 RepID=UPI003522A812